MCVTYPFSQLSSRGAYEETTVPFSQRICMRACALHAAARRSAFFRACGLRRAIRARAAFHARRFNHVHPRQGYLYARADAAHVYRRHADPLRKRQLGRRQPFGGRPALFRHQRDHRAHQSLARRGLHDHQDRGGYAQLSRQPATQRKQWRTHGGQPRTDVALSLRGCRLRDEQHLPAGGAEGAGSRGKRICAVKDSRQRIVRYPRHGG